MPATLTALKALNGELINQAISRARYKVFGGSIETYNQAYEPMLELINNDDTLTLDEKEEARVILTRTKDRFNLLVNKDQTYHCDVCDRKGYTLYWCQPCVTDFLRDEATRWTSGNEQLDRSILEAQIRAPLPSIIPEWLPYDKFSRIHEKENTGNSTIFTAYLKVETYSNWNKETRTLERVNGEDEEVILKQLTPNAQSKNWNEFGNHLHFTSTSPRLVRAFGITRDPTNGDYMLVLMKLECNLREYTFKHPTINWKDINYLFWHLASGIRQLHLNVNLVHRDLHPGNVLISNVSSWHISDLGFSGPSDNVTSVYGILPYLAPEVLSNGEYSVKSDVYAFGMLMYYVATGQSPYVGRKYDLKLQLEIINGSLPKIPDGIPKKYEDLMRRCWDSNPDKRPDTEELLDYFWEKANTEDPEELITRNITEEPSKFQKSSIYYTHNFILHSTKEKGLSELEFGQFSDDQIVECIANYLKRQDSYEQKEVQGSALIGEETTKPEEIAKPEETTKPEGIAKPEEIAKLNEKSKDRLLTRLNKGIGKLFQKIKCCYKNDE